MHFQLQRLRKSHCERGGHVRCVRLLHLTEEEKPFHTSCFRCHQCHRLINTNVYARVSDAIYCLACQPSDAPDAFNNQEIPKDVVQTPEHDEQKLFSGNMVTTMNNMVLSSPTTEGPSAVQHENPTTTAGSTESSEAAYSGLWPLTHARDEAPNSRHKRSHTISGAIEPRHSDSDEDPSGANALSSYVDDIDLASDRPVSDAGVTDSRQDVDERSSKSFEQAYDQLSEMIQMDIVHSYYQMQSQATTPTPHLMGSAPVSPSKDLHLGRRTDLSSADAGARTSLHLDSQSPEDPAQPSSGDITLSPNTAAKDSALEEKDEPRDPWHRPSSFTDSEIMRSLSMYDSEFEALLATPDLARQRSSFDSVRATFAGLRASISSEARNSIADLRASWGDQRSSNVSSELVERIVHDLEADNDNIRHAWYAPPASGRTTSPAAPVELDTAEPETMATAAAAPRAASDVPSATTESPTSDGPVPSLHTSHESAAAEPHTRAGVLDELTQLEVQRHVALSELMALRQVGAKEDASIRTRVELVLDSLMAHLDTVKLEYVHELEELAVMRQALRHEIHPMIQVRNTLLGEMQRLAQQIDELHVEVNRLEQRNSMVRSMQHPSVQATPVDKPLPAMREPIPLINEPPPPRHPSATAPPQESSTPATLHESQNNAPLPPLPSPRKFRWMKPRLIKPLDLGSFGETLLLPGQEFARTAQNTTISPPVPPKDPSTMPRSSTDVTGSPTHTRSSSGSHLTCFMLGRPLREQAQLDGSLVPHLVEWCVAAVEAYGLDDEGLYRKSGSSQQQKQLLHMLDSGRSLDVTEAMQWSDISVVTGVLKLYLRELPEPLITREMHPHFVEFGERVVSLALAPAQSAMRSLLEQLPSEHVATLGCMCHHLAVVDQHSSKNLMSTRNLSLVFGRTSRSV